MKYVVAMILTLLALIISIVFYQTIIAKNGESNKNPILCTQFHFENKKIEADPIVIGLSNDTHYPKVWLIGVGWFERYTSDGKFVFDDHGKIIESTPSGDTSYVCDLWKIMNDDSDSKAVEIPTELKSDLNSITSSEIDGAIIGNGKKYRARIDLLKTASFYEYTPKYFGFIAFKKETINKIAYGKYNNMLIYFEIHIDNHKMCFLTLDESKEIDELLQSLKNKYVD